MKTYAVRVLEEDVEIEALGHEITADGYLQLRDETGVIAVFVSWTYFIVG